MASEKLDRLLDHLLTAAQRYLSANGEFFPFGARMLSGGQIIPTYAYDGREQPPSSEVILNLRAALARLVLDKPVDVCGTARDARLGRGDGETEDAIVVELESAAESACVALPYEQSGGALQFGSLVRLPYEPTIFPRDR